MSENEAILIRKELRKIMDQYINTYHNLEKSPELKYRDR